ncbi:preprotein translocase subunit SecE [Vermiphilus pyriformis]|jgi:preprotein translocase subunit SecE|uniref:Protein translocase subunit SecE n=1 Tax=candidate division TM6 bacterium JCVI TM6SC1 TaxID=1306947 RepID=A0A0D2GPF8_9BACT|nr:hypothetical protein J120_02850 [candidate division TM6 bacterium JCVI TM6SC1]UNE35286.1 MAG: preprotein translocase subunit SecE [Vermiphilus pyriformis]
MKDVINFLVEVRQEIAKIVWPKWNDFVGSSLVVIVLVCLFAIYLWLIDQGCSKLIGFIFKWYSSL